MRGRKNKNIYIIYDGRYFTDRRRAMELDVCGSLGEAMDVREDYGEGNAIVEARRIGAAQFRETGRVW